jgi:hypothetical protein
MRVFPNPVGSGSLWFDNPATADGTPVAYDPQPWAFLPMPPFCANREVIGCNLYSTTVAVIWRFI